MENGIDPVTLEIVKNGLSSVADEMALVILRTAYSPTVRDGMDFSTAVFDREGRTIAQSVTMAAHLGSFPNVMQRVMSEQAATLRPGDLLIVNDPYIGGGMHLPDIYMIKPIFVGDLLVGFAGATTHHVDVGGIVPGSMALHATEIFQEGLRIPLVKLYEEGVPNAALFALVETNSRLPSLIVGDLRAQVAACKAGERGIVNLVDKHGAEGFGRYCEALHDYAERLTRSAIAAMPDGEYIFEDCIDGLGEHPEPITFKVKLTIAGDDLEVDWSGSNKQVQAGINGPIASTISVTYGSVRSAIGVSVPNCDGFSRALTIKTEPGTICDPLAPAACAQRGIIVYRMYDMLISAFAQIIPDRLPAQGEGGPSVVVWSGQADGRQWLLSDGILGSWGGRPEKDGVDGIANPLGNMSNQPIELIEARLPLKITEYGLVNDSGGAGRHRGGLAVRRSYELLAAEAQIGLRSDRRNHLAIGFQGGLPGSPSLNILADGDGQQLLAVCPLRLTNLSQGDRFTHITPGAAGLGDPLTREPELVLADVLDEKISAEFAANIYGVVLDEDRRTVDIERTEAARRKLALLSYEERGAVQAQIFATSNRLEAVFA
ncbi:hydantoinase B/oxoprolinase family protein [Sphingomonas sp. YL-JM2C]